jgi:hypothetical protein
MEHQVILKDVKCHPTTGYIEVDLVTLTHTEGRWAEGPIKTYGTDAHVIAAKYSGDEMLWLAAMKGQHLEHVKGQGKNIDALTKLKGTAI